MCGHFHATLSSSVKNHVGRLDPSCAVFRRLFSEYGCSQSAHRNLMFVWYQFCFPQKIQYKILGWANSKCQCIMFVLRDIFQFSDPSFHALLHRNAGVLQPTGVRTSLCWASFQGLCEGKRRLACFPNSGGFKLSKWHAVDHTEWLCASHLLISLKFHSDFTSTLGPYIS